MIKRVLEISKGPAHLSVRHRQLVIARPDEAEVRVPCADLGIVLVDHPAVTYTHAVFNALLEAGAVLVSCGHGHQPNGMWLPMESHTLFGERMRAQIAAAGPLKKRIWQAVVVVKLQQQARVLHAFTGQDEGLFALAGRVKSGDADNREAVGALRYWRALLGKRFRRERNGDPPNHLLNYGYAVLRSAMARSISGAGLLPAFGVHHHHRANAFGLADDLMEPYRPLVDQCVRRLSDAGMGEAELGPEVKRALLGTLIASVAIRGMRTSVLLALHATATSFWAAIESRRPAALELPMGLAEDGERGHATGGDVDKVANGVDFRDV